MSNYILKQIKRIKSIIFYRFITPIKKIPGIVSSSIYQIHKFFLLLIGRKKILLYTDSRGTNIWNHFNYDHYGKRLSKIYYVDSYYCPHKWTTTLDFFDFIKDKDLTKYDFVILHTGIVDFSPRCQKDAIEKIYQNKKQKFIDIFPEDIGFEYLNTDLGCEYENDKTINLYSVDMAKSYLIPKLMEINNLLWISPNRIDINWKGNYWKDRPKNIGIIEEYANLFLSELPNTIDLMVWNLDEVKKYTFDNIHLNRMGSDYLYDVLIKKINQDYNGN